MSCSSTQLSDAGEAQTAAPLYREKHSTTEPLRSPLQALNILLIYVHHSTAIYNPFPLYQFPHFYHYHHTNVHQIRSYVHLQHSHNSVGY